MEREETGETITAEAKPRPKRGWSTHVRLSDAEYRSACADQEARGKSIPELLKEAYFGGKPTAILMTKEDVKRLLSEMLRQGNNLNQIARKLNAGFPTAVEREFQVVRAAYNGLIALIRSKAVTT